MNLELKALLALVLAGFKTAKDAANKSDFVMVVLPDTYKIAMAMPAVVTNWGDLNDEIKALVGTQQETDLVAYVMSDILPGVTDSAKAKAITAAALDLVVTVAEKAIALEQAIKA